MTTYSQAFLDKIAQKPNWLTESEKARTYATEAGWVYKDLTPNTVPELIMAIPGLSAILDANTTGGLALDRVYDLLFPPTSVGFTRRSRRRYLINVGLHESVVSSGGEVTFALDIGGANTQAANAIGGDITADLIPGTPITTTIPANTTFGKVQFELPELSENPSVLHIHLDGTTAVSVINNTLGNLYDSEGHQMATANTALINGYEFDIVGEV